MAGIPRRVPGKSALENCKIISHRGEHDNITVFENTLSAFHNARRNGVWGIECDLRWTADQVPVICHDATALRVFNDPVAIGDVRLDDLRRRVPWIPTLEELLAEFGGNTHLMLELKAEPFPRPELQRERLRALLAPWEPGRDYHLLALDPTLFQLFPVVPPRYCCPVAEENVTELLKITLESGYGGLGGHFLLLNDRVKQQLDVAECRLGTGFVASRNCLFRELNRGVEWIFSNDAVKLQKIRDRSLARL